MVYRKKHNKTKKHPHLLCLQHRILSLRPRKGKKTNLWIIAPFSHALSCSCPEVKPQWSGTAGGEEDCNWEWRRVLLRQSIHTQQVAILYFETTSGIPLAALGTCPVVAVCALLNRKCSKCIFKRNRPITCDLLSSHWSVSMWQNQCKNSQSALLKDACWSLTTTVLAVAGAEPVTGHGMICISVYGNLSLTRPECLEIMFPVTRGWPLT